MNLGAFKASVQISVLSPKGEFDLSNHFCSTLVALFHPDRDLGHI